MGARPSPRNCCAADSTGDASRQFDWKHLHFKEALSCQASYQLISTSQSNNFWRQLLKAEERGIFPGFQLLLRLCGSFQNRLRAVNLKSSCREETTRLQDESLDGLTLTSWSWAKPSVANSSCYKRESMYKLFWKWKDTKRRCVSKFTWIYNKVRSSSLMSGSFLQKRHRLDPCWVGIVGEIACPNSYLSRNPFKAWNKTKRTVVCYESIITMTRMVGFSIQNKI